ncbi:undecaprenyl-phosphate glucose phosphotransferase, partial [Crocinitomicaceae bacterium]|nr:undecaprenyl-phosphate glucose phosphotransferase [Crocinitomicaceae bacterium]
HRFSRYMKTIFLFWDLVLLSASNTISCYIRDGSLKSLNNKDDQTTFFMILLVWVVLVLSKDAYKIIRIEKIYTTLSRTIKLILIHLGGVALFIIILNFDNVSRLRMLYFYIVFFVLVLLFRILFLKALKHARSQGYNYRNVIIIGVNEMAGRMNQILNNDLSYGYKVAGVFSNVTNLNIDHSMTNLGGLSDVETYLSENKVDEMFIALDYKETDQIPKLIQLCERYMVRLKIIPNFQKYTNMRRVSIDFYDNTPVMMFRKEPLELVINRIQKKIFDIIFSSLIIGLIFSWLFPLLWILIKLESKGPALYKQVRSGENNRHFTCYKFRSMRQSKTDEFIQATENDPRVTAIGKFIRRTSIDEFPQFFNVFLGHMSVVGPRPHPIKLDDQYIKLINNYKVRHFSKPGITGWAQVKGYRGETKEVIAMKMRVEYDIWYIENWTFLLDLKIIWMTVTNMLRGEENAN